MRAIDLLRRCRGLSGLSGVVTGTRRFIRAMSVQIPIWQRAVAKLPGPGDPTVPPDKEGLFFIGLLPLQRLHLRTKLVYHLVQVLEARQLLLHGRRQLASDLIRSMDRDRVAGCVDDLNSPGRRSALLSASAGDVSHLQAGCSSGIVESEINIQPDSAEERGRTRWEEFVLGIRSQAFELRK